MALLAEAQPLERSRRRDVARIDIGFEPMEVKAVERIGDQRAQRLVHQALAPGRSRQRVAELGAAAAPVEVKERAGADQRAIVVALDPELQRVAAAIAGADVLHVRASCGSTIGGLLQKRITSRSENIANSTARPR